MITTKSTTIHSPIPYYITRQYQPLLINDDDDDDVYDDNNNNNSSATTTSAPIAILSSQLRIGSGGKAIDSTILLHRAIELALSLYTSNDGGLTNFISHLFDNDNDDVGIRRSGGVEGVQATILVRHLADMAQSSTQTLGGRYGRMLSSSLLVLGTQKQQRRTNDDNNKDNNNDDNTLLLWRIDPTGQFYKVIASGIGRGGISAELELIKYVRHWKRGVLHKQKQQLSTQRQQATFTAATTTILTTTTMEEHDDEDDGCSNIEEEEGIIITNNDVRTYLDTLTPNDAIELAIDCLVNGLRHHQQWEDDEVVMVAVLSTAESRNNNNGMMMKTRMMFYHLTETNYEGEYMPLLFIRKHMNFWELL